MTARRPDANQAELVATLREHGAHVQDVSSARPSVGFDLIVARDGVVYLVEVKVDARAKLTAREKLVHHAYQAVGVTIHRVETAEDVERMLKI